MACELGSPTHSQTLFGWGYDYFYQVTGGLQVVDDAPREQTGGSAEGCGFVDEWGQVYGRLRQRVCRFQFPQRVISVGTGHKHAVVVTADGHVYSWGCGFFGRLGHGSETCEEEPRRVDYLWRACRGENTNGDNFDGMPLQVACGRAHSVVVTTNGLVFAWGFNRYFQCGRSEKRGSILLPHRVTLDTLAQDEYVTGVFCGGHHSMALTQLGTVYAWGHATYGRLGHARYNFTTKVISYPRKVDFFTGEDAERSVFKLALGGEHSIALSCSGHVYSWGRGTSGQLGQGRTIDYYTPRRIEFFDDKLVSDVQAGQTHSLAIAAPRSASGNVNPAVYMWGIGYGGGGSSPSAGFDSQDVWTVPRLIDLFAFLDHSATKRCAGAALGGAHTLLLMEEVAANHSTAWGESDSTLMFPNKSAADTNNDEESGNTQVVEDLFSLCRHGRQTSLETLLHDTCTDINVRDKNGNSLLICAAQNGLLPMVKLLVNKGCDLNAQNRKGNTALHFAFSFNFLDCFEFLVKSGANPYIVNQEGKDCYQGIFDDQSLAS